MKRIKNIIRFTIVDWGQCPALRRIQEEALAAKYATKRGGGSYTEDMVRLDRFVRDQYNAKLLFTGWGNLTGIHFKTTRDAIAFQLSTG